MYTQYVYTFFIGQSLGIFPKHNKKGEYYDRRTDYDEQANQS